MKFQILISTMNNKFHKRCLHYIPSHLIVNQITDNVIPIENHLTYNMFETGLSASRNHAIEISTSEICLISDDDLIYLSDIDKKIIKIFELHPDADIITFKTLNPDRVDRKKYKDIAFYHNIRTIMNVSSVEIAFRRKSINKDLCFDERFGLGSRFPTGEEVIFLTDALKKGKKILYYPLPIVIHPLESSGSNYNVSNLAKSKGAMLYRIFSKKSYVLCLLFALKHHKKSPYSFIMFIKQMFKGINEFKKMEQNEK